MENQLKKSEISTFNHDSTGKINTFLLRSHRISSIFEYITSKKGGF